MDLTVMVGDYKSKTQQHSWDEASMKMAIEKVKVREMSLAKAAGVPKTTLFNRTRRDETPVQASVKQLGRFRFV
jgi:hypothetical protein